MRVKLPLVEHQCALGYPQALISVYLVILIQNNNTEIINAQSVQVMTPGSVGTISEQESKHIQISPAGRMTEEGGA